jgi:hypothetical protein
LDISSIPAAWLLNPGGTDLNITRREIPVIRLIRRMNAEASDSQLGLALGLSALIMGLMLWAILWQSTVITYQREIIKWMWTTKFGG